MDVVNGEFPGIATKTCEHSVDLGFKIATSSICNDIDLLLVVIIRVLAALDELIGSRDFKRVRMHETRKL